MALRILVTPVAHSAISTCTRSTSCVRNSPQHTRWYGQGSVLARDEEMSDLAPSHEEHTVDINTLNTSYCESTFQLARTDVPLNNSKGNSAVPMYSLPK